MVAFEKYATKCIKMAIENNSREYGFRKDYTAEHIDCLAFMLATGLSSHNYSNGTRTKFLKHEYRMDWASDKRFAEVWGFTKPEFLLFMFDIEEKEYKATVRKIVKDEFEKFKATNKAA
jgi:hypothetical protein